MRAVVATSWTRADGNADAEALLAELVERFPKEERLFYKIGRKFSRVGTRKVGTWKHLKRRVRAAMAALKGLAGSKRAPDGVDLAPQPTQHATQQSTGSHDYFAASGQFTGESDIMVGGEPTPPPPALPEPAAPPVRMDEAVDEEVVALFQQLGREGLGPELLDLALSSGSVRRPILVEFLEKLALATKGVTCEMIIVGGFQKSAWDAMARRYNEVVSGLVGAPIKLISTWDEFLAEKELSDKALSAVVHAYCPRPGETGVSVGIAFQLLRQLETPSTRVAIYAWFEEQRRRGEVPTLYLWRMVDAGWIYRRYGIKLDYTTGLIGHSGMMAGAKLLRLCLHAATWIGKDDAQRYDWYLQDNELLDLDNEAFETLERQLRVLERDGLDDPWRDGAREMRNWGKIRIVADMAAFDGGQMLTATSRSCKCGRGVLLRVRGVLTCITYRNQYCVPATTVSLAIMNFARSDTYKLELLGTPNIKVAWWNGLSVQERKRRVGGSGSHLCGNQTVSQVRGWFLFRFRGRSETLSRGTGIAKPSSWRRVDGVRGKL